MLVRVLTLRFDAVLAGFDDAELRGFIKDREVLAIRDHFFVHNETPYLAMVVTYTPTRPEVVERSAATRDAGRGRETWRELLEEKDWPLFNTLRDWRNEQARQEGIPPYVICTNRQLADVAHGRPASLSQLAAASPNASRPST